LPVLEKVPAAIGHLLEGVRPGLDKTVYYDARLTRVEHAIAVTSTAFTDHALLPARFTADGEGVSPPLAWSDVPVGAAAVLVIVEDADSPTPAPLVHMIVHHMPGCDGTLAQGAVPSEPSTVATGRNSYLKTGWLPCDPPTGNGEHRYVFQVFALDTVPDLGEHPGRSAVEDALADHTIAKGVLIGTYQRA
jgi:Raf kinase inhibitor-like YbhB/YbcL family protein